MWKLTGRKRWWWLGGALTLCLGASADAQIISGPSGVTFPITTAQGGTGVASPTAHGILVGEGAAAVTPMTLTNGQLLIGSTGADPVAAGLTAGAGITITPGAGSITVAATATGGVTVYDRAFAVTVTNTAVETTLYSKSVAGNTLGATGMFRVTLLGLITDTNATTGAPSTFTVLCKLGGTTLITMIQTTGLDDVVPARFAIGTVPYRLSFELQNLNATNAQVGLARLHSSTIHIAPVSDKVLLFDAFGTGVTGGFVADLLKTKYGTAAIDTTVAQTLAITGQWNAAQATKTFTMHSVLVEQL